MASQVRRTALSAASIAKWVGGTGAEPEAGETASVTVEVGLVSWAGAIEGIIEKNKKMEPLRNNFKRSE